MKKEYIRLSTAANRAKMEVDELISIGTELIAIHKKCAEIINSKTMDYSEKAKKLDELIVRRDRANKIRKKDLIKLMDKQFEAEYAREILQNEIFMAEYRMKKAK